MGISQFHVYHVRRQLRHVWIPVVMMLLLVACGDVSGVSVDAAKAEPTPEPSPTASYTATVTPTQVTVEAVPDDVLPTPTPTAIVLPTPTPTPTPAPFVCPYLYGRTERIALRSSAIAEDVDVLIHLPACYDAYADRSFPVLYLFHGWPLDEHHWDNLGIDEWSDDWASRGLAGPFIIVMPGVGSDGLYVNSSGGPTSFEGFVVDELIPAIDAGYRTWRDPAGRAVGGISRGGVWAIEIAMRHQDLFSIVGGHSPALSLNRPLPQYDPYRLALEGVTGLRFYLDAGDGDWARGGAIQFRNRLEEVGADVTYELHTGGHVDDLWRNGLPDYLEFYSLTWPASYDLLPPWTAAEALTP